MTPSRIALRILRDNALNGDPRSYSYNIYGRTGPTGKTWLCNELRAHGLIFVHDASETMNSWINYSDNSNHFVVDEENKVVTIILNERLSTLDLLSGVKNDEL